MDRKVKQDYSVCNHILQPGDDALEPKGGTLGKTQKAGAGEIPKPLWYDPKTGLFYGARRDHQSDLKYFSGNVGVVPSTSDGYHPKNEPGLPDEGMSVASIDELASSSSVSGSSFTEKTPYFFIIGKNAGASRGNPERFIAYPLDYSDSSIAKIRGFMSRPEAENARKSICSHLESRLLSCSQEITMNVVELNPSKYILEVKLAALDSNIREYACQAFNDVARPYIE